MNQSCLYKTFRKVAIVALYNTFNHIIMKKFANICYCYWTWQNWQLKQSCQHISIGLITQVTEYDTIFRFLAPSSPRYKFSQHWPESTTLGTIKSLIYEIFSTSKPPKACTCINFPHTFAMGQIGGIWFNTSISLDNIEISQIPSEI